MIEIPLDDIDIVFISYDEPDKEKNWANLVSHFPFAKRVDGVTGFDAAHHAAAAAAETDRFITVDGDCRMKNRFWKMKVLRFDDRYSDHVFSWAGTNVVNGLVYGNGSTKCWPREQCANMKTHENAPDARSIVDFCWSIPYLSMRDSLSVTNPAVTPFHGFRAGFREGVKMTLVNGERVSDNTALWSSLWDGNAHKLKGWMSLGSDMPNGLWCIYGARAGMVSSMDPSFDIGHIADYNWFVDMFENLTKDIWRDDYACDGHCPVMNRRWWQEELLDRLELLGDKITDETGVTVPVFNPEQSEFLKGMNEYKDRQTEVVIF